VGAYFEIILLILMIASAMVAAVDKWIFEKNRTPGEKMPVLAEYARSLFSVFLIVIIIRTFIIEPFRIPSGSMLPGLKVGDFIVVEKFAYDLRWPVWHGKILSIGDPKCGDVVVLHYPVNPQVDFIKRVIGLPGDRISYINKQLYINDKAIPQRQIATEIEPVNSNTQPSSLYQLTLPDKTFTIYNLPWRKAQDFKDLVVPEGEYFVMGDNRDNSDDSRYWGFVPKAYFVGKAVVIWMSWDSDNDSIRWHRIGSLVH